MTQKARYRLNALQTRCPGRHLPLYISMLFLIRGSKNTFCPVTLLFLKILNVSFRFNLCGVLAFNCAEHVGEGKGSGFTFCHMNPRLHCDGIK